VRSLTLTAVGRLELTDQPIPEPRPGEALVRMRAVGICGSDLHAYAHGRPGMEPPLVLGHECAGEVVAVGPAVDPALVGVAAAVVPTIACGNCPYCWRGESNICPNRLIVGLGLPGGLAEYVRVPVRNIVPLPDGFPWPRAGVVEPVAVAVHLFDRLLRGLPGPTIVLGAGFLGLVCLQLARLAGAPTVAVSDVQPHRLERARALGADVVVDAREASPVAALRRSVGGEGAALVVDAAGVTATRRQAVDLARPGGTVGLLGLTDVESSLDFVQVVRKELLLVASYAATPLDFPRAVGLMASGSLEVDHLLRAYPLAVAPEVFERLASGADIVKAVVQPDR
jgi:L-iditol 2-dehydrogenase